jgi:hypothetical protein
MFKNGAKNAFPLTKGRIASQPTVSDQSNPEDNLEDRGRDDSSVDDENAEQTDEEGDYDDEDVAGHARIGRKRKRLAQ